MPPKLLSKRRNRDDDSSPARQKKGKRREPTYDTYDEALDGGVEMEEKGERYRDGEKAQRFYEKAAELYQKAMQFDETFDATYNLARVQYVLASSFLLPPSALDIYGSSIALYRQALGMTDSPLLQIDACYNIAQSCTGLADAMEDIEGERVADGVAELRDAARVFLERAAVMQESWIRSHASAPEGEEEAGAVADAASATTTEAIEAEAEPAEVAELAGPSDDMAVDSADSDDEGEAGGEGAGGRAVFEEHVPTPSALVDTLLALVDLHLTVLESTSSPASDAIAPVLALAAAHVAPGQQAALDLAEIAVLLAEDRVVWRMYRAEASAASGAARSVEGAARALDALLASLDVSPPDDASVRADILTTLADTHAAAAARVAFVARNEPEFILGAPSPAGQQAWAHAGAAVDALTRALALPAPGLPPLFKAHALSVLSAASLFRARLADMSSAAHANAAQLLDNAHTYAARAAAALGWTIDGARIEPGYPAGWDAEALGRSVVLQLARVGYYAAKVGGEDKGKGLVESLKGTGPRNLGRRDVERWLEDIEDDEGVVSAEERAHWDALVPAPVSPEAILNK
ncbi:hypothetical protein Q5752_004970 [Cryptotrichosporon argae]